jgi:sialic acid synthase SpsE
VSMYPTPYGSVHLRAIQDLQSEFDLPVGLSDHSVGIYTCLGGVALGACALEKHFTITRSWPGPDMPISIEPDELRELVVGSRAVWQGMIGGKEIQPGEQSAIDFAYASVVSIAPIAAGETFGLDNIWVKRPGTGEFLAKDLESILGRRAVRDVPAEVQITSEDLA